MTSEAKLMELYKSWDALLKHKDKMGHTILELIAHPDATQEQIAEVVPRYRDVVGMLRKHRPVIIEALNKGRSMPVRNALDKVRDAHI